jgi:hypothetical protein
MCRDFRETDILQAFYSSLEPSLRSQMTESGLYMGLYSPFIFRTLIAYVPHRRDKSVRGNTDPF